MVESWLVPRVGFDQLSPRKYEDMVSVLLSHDRQTASDGRHW
jgi:hypothetical protein